MNSYSPDLDPRFTPKGERKIAIVNDSRSMFGVANSINGIGVNPGDIVSQKDFLNIYKDFSNNFKKGYTYFNSDSGQIISTLAKNYPDGASCGIAYNGDLLYAAQGGGVEDPADASDFHFCNLDDSLIALDMVVINKNVVSNQQKCDKLYEIIKDICLSGTSDGEDITKKNADGLYTYDSMQNFADVEYTSPLNKVYNYVMTGNFFEGTEAQIKLYRKIFDINTKIDNVTDYVEERMSSELAKSNMH
ncbi:MAG: hypothetical protein K2M43_00635 [Mycoplasmoidaceae bacterium]|nr:hypothetical protein [Mycoplasmoidaceae bacterium]